MIKSVKVKTSKIQGKGVYATTNIKKGEVILEIDDTHVVTDTSKLTKEQNEFDCDYLAGGKVVLMQPPEKYINHSCEPNSYVKTNKGIRNVLAMKNIKKGEEITFDYCINGNNDGTFKCNCVSKNCRKTYQGDFFKLPIKTQLKYLPYLDTWFIEEHKDKVDKLLEATRKKFLT